MNSLSSGSSICISCLYFLNHKVYILKAKVYWANGSKHRSNTGCPCLLSVAVIQQHEQRQHGRKGLICFMSLYHSLSQWEVRAGAESKRKEQGLWFIGLLSMLVQSAFL